MFPLNQAIPQNILSIFGILIYRKICNSSILCWTIVFFSLYSPISKLNTQNLSSRLKHKHLQGKPSIEKLKIPLIYRHNQNREKMLRCTCVFCVLPFYIKDVKNVNDYWNSRMSEIPKKKCSFSKCVCCLCSWFARSHPTLFSDRILAYEIFIAIAIEYIRQNVRGWLLLIISQ